MGFLIYIYMENDTQKKSQSALREEEVLRFWEEQDIFNKTLKKNSPEGEFIFYEGPPTANGKPGIHHLEARSFKDAIPRYKTMRGYHVRRKGGWDTHGLPVELQVEKKLGLNSKKAIEEYGIAKFNQECKESVWEYVDIWDTFTKRIGYWIDEKNPYITYHNTYIESVWNILKHVNEQKLLYKDYKVVPWCPRCGTALSSHELAQGYEDVKDLSVTAKFKVKGQEDTYILAWTTTPWTLPGNVALAVGKDITYSVFEVLKEISGFSLKLGDTIILAESAIERVLNDYLKNGGELKPKGKVLGEKLLNIEYEPLYPYLADTLSDTEKPKLEKAFKVYTADFVTTEDGTGVVHTAVMYGQDDFELGTQIGLPKHHLVGLDGRFLPGTGPFEGRFVKDEDVAVDIVKDLAHRELLFKKERYEHSYPHCWRCHTPLIYYARDSWYIRMSSLRSKLVAENESINWEPAHIREGRFGEWLKDVKDWAISRERYWGTPLPVWLCESCKKVSVIGSIAELKSQTKKSSNSYTIMRHGQTEHNLLGLVCTVMGNDSHLTEEGKQKVAESVQKLKKDGIDLIISSPFGRARETTKIVQDILGLDDSQVSIDDRLHEMSIPMYEGKTWKEYHDEYPKTVENFSQAPEGNESYLDVKCRMMDFLYDLEEKYTNKNILIVTHGGPSWLAVAGTRGLTAEQSLQLIRDKKDFHFLDNGEYITLDFVPIPHNEKYELDLHRPFIDSVELVCDCDGTLSRAKEVMDVWFDSGAMPFAQDHYPFENKEFVDDLGYPADYICEAIDQTRGWFYTLHAVGTLMGRGKAYKNVICLGHILDENGKKMSKSLGNIVDPWLMIDKYGVDTLRLWMYSVNQPGESKNFDEKTVTELHNKVFNLLYNVLAFYKLYREPRLETVEYKKSSNVLDQWIVARLNQLVESTTNQLDGYKLLEPVRAVRDFIDDLSTWYVRRSRDRMKVVSVKLDTSDEARQTLYFVLKTLAKIIAPLAPFTAEDIWQELRNENDPESVHLCDWPNAYAFDEAVITDMQTIRRIVTFGLEARQKAGIKVRQPLHELKVRGAQVSNTYGEILKDELNVKQITFDDSLQTPVELDTHITLELRAEGQYRELVRAVQDMRKKQGLNPNDTIVLEIETSVEGQELISQFESEFLKTVGAKELRIVENQGVEIKIDELVFIVRITQ
jgi:isoleucyl-tRNA synthetase